MEENEELEGRTVPSSDHIELNNKKKKKRIVSDDEDAGVIKVKKAKTVKALLEEKRITTEINPIGKIILFLHQIVALFHYIWINSTSFLLINTNSALVLHYFDSILSEN